MSWWLQRIKAERRGEMEVGKEGRKEGRKGPIHTTRWTYPITSERRIAFLILILAVSLRPATFTAPWCPIFIG